MDFTSPLRVVASGLDGPVLEAIVRADRPLTGREVARVLGQSSHSGVRGALRRLVAQGVVTSLPAGRAHIYLFNRDHVAAAHIEALVRTPTEVVRRLRQTIAAWEVPAVWAVITGPVADGVATADDSIDLLLLRSDEIDEDDPAWRAQVESAARALSAWTGNDVRVSEFAVDDVERGIGAPELRAAMADGIDLVGSPGAHEATVAVHMDR